MTCPLSAAPLRSSGLRVPIIAPGGSSANAILWKVVAAASNATEAEFSIDRSTPCHSNASAQNPRVDGRGSTSGVGSPGSVFAGCEFGAKPDGRLSADDRSA